MALFKGGKDTVMHAFAKAEPHYNNDYLYKASN